MASGLMASEHLQPRVRPLRLKLRYAHVFGVSVGSCLRVHVCPWVHICVYMYVCVYMSVLMSLHTLDAYVDIYFHARRVVRCAQTLHPRMIWRRRENGTNRLHLCCRHLRSRRASRWLTNVKRFLCLCPNTKPKSILVLASGQGLVERFLLMFW